MYRLLDRSGSVGVSVYPWCIGQVVRGGLGWMRAPGVVCVLYWYVCRSVTMCIHCLAAVMVFALDRSEAAAEVVQMMVESLTLPGARASIHHIPSALMYMR